MSCLFTWHVSSAQQRETACTGQTLDLVLEKCRTLQFGTVSIVVEKDLQTISLFDNGKRKWRRKIIDEENADFRGTPRLRYIKIQRDKMIVFYGSQAIDTLRLKNGRAFR